MTTTTTYLPIHPGPRAPMTTTMTLTMAESTKSGAVSSCPSCGMGLPRASQTGFDAQMQIEDLQSQVRLLNQKAASAVDKLADYEDEIQRLRAAQKEQAQQKPAVPQVEPVDDERAASPSKFSYLPVQNPLSSFLTSKKSTPSLEAAQAARSTSSTIDLAAALNREQQLRQAAEGKLDQASGELEELSVQLFQQANEMVATERKARAKLEERVELLEKRDGEKRKRLEKLEGAVQRIERVRGLLAPGR